MPAADDHPIRLLRMRAGVSQSALAQAAGVTRATVAQIEEGRVKTVNRQVIASIARLARTDPSAVVDAVTVWQRKPTEKDALSLRAKNTLALPPHLVAQYRSFVQWRRDVAVTPTAFASLVKIPRTTLVKYERGEVAMPKVLYRALNTQLGLPEDYIEELRKLDVNS